MTYKRQKKPTTQKDVDRFGHTLTSKDQMNVGTGSYHLHQADMDYLPQEVTYLEHKDLPTCTATV